MNPFVPSLLKPFDSPKTNGFLESVATHARSIMYLWPCLNFRLSNNHVTERRCPNRHPLRGRRLPGAVLGRVDCFDKVAGTRVTLCFVISAFYSAIDTFMESSQETEKNHTLSPSHQARAVTAASVVEATSMILRKPLISNTSRTDGAKQLSSKRPPVCRARLASISTTRRPALEM